MKNFNKHLAELNSMFMQYGVWEEHLIPKQSVKEEEMHLGPEYYEDTRPYSKWKKYSRTVWKTTRDQDLKTLEHFEKRGWQDYHLDHKISVWYGYKNNIPPEVIGHISNLRMIPYEENLKKGRACYLEELKE